MSDNGEQSNETFSNSTNGTIQLPLALYALHSIATPFGVFVHFVVLSVLVKHRKIFNKSYYTLMIGVDIFDMIILITLIVRFVALATDLDPGIISVIVYISLGLGCYPSYLCQIAQASNRLVAIACPTSYDSLFSRIRLLLILFGSAAFGSIAMTFFATWHELRTGWKEIFDHLSSDASQAWAIFDQVVNYSTCSLLTIIYAAAICLFRWRKWKSSTGPNQATPAIEVKLTLHGVCITVNMIVQEILFISNPDDPFAWEYCYVLAFTLDPIVLLILDSKLRSYVRRTWCCCCRLGGSVSSSQVQSIKLHAS